MLTVVAEDVVDKLELDWLAKVVAELVVAEFVVARLDLEDCGVCSPKTGRVVTVVIGAKRASRNLVLNLACSTCEGAT
jgi:hypothetical protein